MKFTITAGHSNTDSGAVANGLRETDLARELRNILAGKLRDLGHTVVTDGTGGINLPLANAIKLIKGSDVALEIHFNAVANSAANGVETISLPKDKLLSQRLSRAVAVTLGSRIRGSDGWIDQSRSDRGRLGYVSAGGLILEVGFITNKAEITAYQERSWLVASAIAKVLDDWSKK